MNRKIKAHTYVMGVFLLSLFSFPAWADPTPQKVLTDVDLAMMANAPGMSPLPLGDNRYTTDWPRKGYIYLCHVPENAEGGGGAQLAGDWIHGSTWDPRSKIAVKGQISWNEATFSNTISGSWRTLLGNGLPLGQTTGIFPIQSDDPAYRFDRNPNRIAPHMLRDMFPVNPVYADTPFCMGMESGVMLTGVPLFNGFDAGLRDAAAHELQDSCGGHPQRSGEYHYHSLSPCLHDIGVKTVLGYALDGFPITGPMVAPGRYLMTDNLDECHGITSEIIEDGQKKVSYHYVMTEDFPYSVSCFRGQPVRVKPSDNPNLSGGEQDNNRPSGPPPEAINACVNKDDGLPCMFMSPHGDMISGVCRRPEGHMLACVPQH